MDSQHDFSVQLRALRTQAGLTQGQLADRLGLSTSYVHQLEAGRRTPSDSTVKLVNEIAPRLKEESVGYIDTVTARGLPVFSWEDLTYWTVDSCRTSKHRMELPNFSEGVVVRAESNAMAPAIEVGDMLVACPHESVRSGEIVVAKLASGEVLLRRMQRLAGGQGIRLFAEDSRLRDEDLPASDLAWAWPVCAVWRALRKRD
jgi:predicted transcriptional regulator